MKIARIKNKRRFLSDLLVKTGVARVANALHSPTLTVFGFHRIQKQNHHCDFDDETFDNTQVEDFSEILDILKKEGDAVTESDIVSSIASGKPLPKRSFLITFDDGYIECVSVAMPMLKERSLPAIFFIPTEAMDDRKLGWWDLLAWSLKQSKTREITVRGKKYHFDDDITFTLECFKQEMKLESSLKNSTLVEEVAKACQVELPTLQQSSGQLITWDDVRLLRKNGFSIGSHTVSHRVLSTLSLEEQRAELSLSKKRIEEKLGEAIYSLSYPVGGYEHFHQETKSIARECGYAAAFSYHTGVNFLGRAGNAIDAFDIKRIGAPRYRNELATALCMPELFSRRVCSLEQPRSAPRN